MIVKVPLDAPAMARALFWAQVSIVFLIIAQGFNLLALVLHLLSVHK